MTNENPTPSSSLGEKLKARPALGWAVTIGVAVAVFLLGLLAASVTSRRAEVASIYNNKKVEITGVDPNNEKWGLNYPREYETWKKTQNMDFRSKHLGNTFEDQLEARSAMVVLWAGYAFSRSYAAPRGHMYAVEDVRNTLRTFTPRDAQDLPQQPGTCWACKSPDVPRLMGEKGVGEYYKAPWGTWGSEVVNPIGCADCHDPKTMNLTITRPALTEALERQGKDISKAPLQEMRSLVCAQCHVEYYFTADTKYLTFPWDKGTSVEAMEEYYDKIQFSDWTHSVSKTPLLKAQHPDYELFLLGPHGQRGVSCADCHMPYMSVGGVKYSNHQIMSPLSNVASTCQICHRDTEENLKGYVYFNQDKVLEIRNRVEAELVKAHVMAKAAWDAGATQAEMAAPQRLIREAQWRWDFGVASHGGSFHAPVETQRILAHALDRSLSAQLGLQKLLFAKGVSQVAMPDVSTKAKAQAYIGLDMGKLGSEKEQWKKTVVPQWLQEAKAAGR